MQLHPTHFASCLTLVLALSLGLSSQAQPTATVTTLADDLGYPPGTRLLIVHADDLGMANSVNEASFRGLLAGSVNSASIMMPTPWVPQVAAFAKTHPELDLGLHLTLTSEWTNYRWGPMASDSVSSLLDEDHYLHGLCNEMAATATVEAVEIELRAQVEQALRLGIRPTHFDSHMGCLFWTKPAFFGAYLRLGREYDVPLLLDRNQVRGSTPELRAFIQPSDMAIDHVIGISSGKAGTFQTEYDSIMHVMQPGVNVLLLHCGIDNDELQNAFAPQIPFGATWRQEDFDYFTSNHFREVLAKEKIQLVTWRELYSKWKAQGKKPVSRATSKR